MGFPYIGNCFRSELVQVTNSRVLSLHFNSAILLNNTCSKFCTGLCCHNTLCPGLVWRLLNDCTLLYCALLSKNEVKCEQLLMSSSTTIFTSLTLQLSIIFSLRYVDVIDRHLANAKVFHQTRKLEFVVVYHTDYVC